MGKLKRKLFGKGKQKKASSGENTPMLSQETPEKWETHGFQGIKNIAGALLKKATSEKKDAREKLVATQEPKSSGTVCAALTFPVAWPALASSASFHHGTSI